MHIFVGSTNPVKIKAVVQATSHTWPKARIQGIEVESGVSAQPWGDEETRRGAENRARRALQLGMDRKNKLSHSTTGSFMSGLNQTDQDDMVIGVGLEGGVFEQENGELWNTVWVSVTDPTGKIISANGERFLLPKSLTKLIQAGKEMGPAMDELTGASNIKQKQGMIGIITHGFIDRTEMYAGLVKLAIGLWYGRDWEISVT